MAEGVLAGARRFGMRARRHLHGRFQRLRVRLEQHIGATDGSVTCGPPLPWPALAAPPGCAARMPWTWHEWRDPAYASLADAVHAHRLTLLSTVPVAVSFGDAERKSRIASLASELQPDVVARYEPIDWHRDFNSGHRWDPAELYLDVRVAPVPGADIKIPRELSRFQHVGALARGDLHDGGVELMLEMLDWIVANPYPRGVNWASTMDVALRAVNWIWGMRLFEPVLKSFPCALGVVAGSLEQHGTHILKNLEYYEECTTNHYLSNVAGLVYLGAALPDLPQSDGWLLFGLQELVSEMERQVYPDGMSWEASTHYHRLVAEMFASCAALAERLPAARRTRLASFDPHAWRTKPPLKSPQSSGLRLTAAGPVLPGAFYARLGAMGELTAALTKPNCKVPQVGDNDSGRAHKLLPGVADDVRDHRHLLALIGELLGRDDLRALAGPAAREGELIAGGLGALAPQSSASASPQGSALFACAGIAVLRTAQAYVAVTCGPNGQGGRGGHGHNDKLSFELNVHGRDIVVDAGCPVYTADPQARNRYRSTAAHSTIAVDGLEQDVWPAGMAGLFRLPERSAPRLELIAAHAAAGSHGGYGAPHRREFRLEPGRLQIDDTLDLSAERRIVFNLDPAVRCEQATAETNGVRFILAHEAGPSVVITISGANDPRVGDGCFSIGYGVPVPTRNLSARMVGPRARTEICWTD